MDVDDPYFDPDDPRSDRLLGRTRYELDLEAGVSALPDVEGPRNGSAGGVRHADEDSAGRATGLPVPDRADIAAAAESELAAARRSLRGFVARDNRGAATGVLRALEDVRDPERPPGEGEPTGGTDSAGAAAERDAVDEYLRGKGKGHHTRKTNRTKAKATAEPTRFTKTAFDFEVEDLRMLHSGALMVRLAIPAHSTNDAWKLHTAVGLLLHANISLV